MDKILRLGRERVDVVVSAGLFVAALLLYLATMAPTVAAIYDDSLEFPLVVHRLAIAHPTGYPLYTLLGRLFMSVPAGDVAYRLHLLSAVCAAGAIAVLYIAARLMRLQPVGAAAAGLFLAVSPVFWSQALIAEVYTLNALFVSLVLALAAAWGSGAARRPAVLGALALVFGLSLTHHRTMLLLAPGLLAYLLVGRGRGEQATDDRLPRSAVVWLPLLFALPLLLYAYIPLRGAVTSSLDGTYVNTLQGFLSWVLASSYTSFLRDNPLQQSAMTATAYLTLLNEQFGWGGLLLVLLGVVWMIVRRRPVLLLLALAWLAVVAFVRLYRVADAPVFLIPSFMVAALAIGAGVHALAVGAVPQIGATLLRRKRAAATTPPAASRVAGLRLWLTAAVVVILAALLLADNVPQLDMSDEWAVHNYAVDVLSQPLEPAAAIVGILGEMTLLRYMQETHAMRPDIQTVAADDDAQRLAAVARLLAEGRPVYLTRPLPGLGKTHPLRATGPLLRVLTSSATVPPAAPASSLAVFGDSIALLTYTLSGLSPDIRPQSFPQQEQPHIVEAGGRLRLLLSWQTTRAVDKEYRLTIRLKSPTGRLLQQRDSGPVHDGYATSLWRVGEIVVDAHDIMVPVGTPPGLYDVEIGLYDPADLQLLPVAGRQELLTIGPVSIVRPQAKVRLGNLPRHSQPRPALTIPRGQFDYSLERLGIEHVLRSNLQNEFTLYGYGLSRRPLAPGQAVDVTLLWQAMRPPSGERVVFVQLRDKDDRLWASHAGQPGDGAYPTRQWLRDEVVRDVHTLQIPADMPDGIYYLQAGMYDPSGSPLTVLRLTRRSLDHVDLGAVEVRGRQRTREIPPVQVTVNARVGELARLVGGNIGVGEVGVGLSADGLAARAGDTIKLDLVWQAMEPTRISYTVFVHLVAPDGRVVSQDDSIPGRGTLPTTSWVRGEVLSDSYALTIPATATPGQYQIAVGLYDARTEKRLPIWDASGASIGDSLLLVKVHVERAL